MINYIHVTFVSLPGTNLNLASSILYSSDTAAITSKSTCPASQLPSCISLVIYAGHCQNFTPEQYNEVQQEFL